MRANGCTTALRAHRIGIPAAATIGGALLVAGAMLGSGADAAPLQSLRVCADPGNMPLSNDKREGYQNKIAEVLAASLGTTAQYDWRPSTERGLIRATLDANYCDVLLDMPAGMERVLTTKPLYRSSFVLAYRDDRGIAIKNLDDPQLKKLKVGVYQMSAIRVALDAHGVKRNTVTHHISYDGQHHPERQPSYQVQQVVDGKLDVAAIWGPFAGYYKTIKKAPLVIQPVNVMEDRERMEFDMVLAVRRDDAAFKRTIEQALLREKDKIRKILVDYGVPLVKCEACIIDGDLPSHGPYDAAPETIVQAPDADQDDRVSLAVLEKWLQQGADVNAELHNAVIAGDPERVRYLVEERRAALGTRDAEGYTPLHNAVRRGNVELSQYLIAHGSNVNDSDRDGWTPLMFAAWADNAELVGKLAAAGAGLEAKNPAGLTPLGIAALHGKAQAADALLGAGAASDVALGAGGYTPLMLAVAGGWTDIVEQLVGKGANVNARNLGGVTALMIAAAGDTPDVAAVLLRAGADPALSSEDGRTALSIAKERSSLALIRLLGGTGSRAGSQYQPRAPAHEAVRAA